MMMSHPFSLYLHGTLGKRLSQGYVITAVHTNKMDPLWTLRVVKVLCDTFCIIETVCRNSQAHFLHA